MKIKIRQVISIIVLVLWGIVFGLNILPVTASASANKNPGYISASASDLRILKDNDGNIAISGKVESHNFAVVGRLFSVSDNINSNKIYFVENSRDVKSPVVVLNIEFEVNAAEHNVSVSKQTLVGKNVIRIAIYTENTFYYAEQEYNIDTIITNNVEVLSSSEKNDVLSDIISNSTWYTHLKQDNAVYESDLESVKNSKSRITPSYDESLDQKDIDNISKIGRTKFTVEQFIYGDTQTGGYLLHSVEWPAGSGNILTSCLYYEYTKIQPSTYSNLAILDVELTMDRQYLYVASSNIIGRHAIGTDFRIYDAKLALGCAGNGYDYIWQQKTYFNDYGSGSNNVLIAAKNVAKAYVLLKDKTGVLSIADAFFSSFTGNAGTNIPNYQVITWPNTYEDHYVSTKHNKEINTMVRAIRLDTDGHLLADELDSLYIEAYVEDRDYANSVTNITLTKMIRYAFSYNLRSRNFYWLWINRGDDRGEVTHESNRAYSK